MPMGKSMDSQENIMEENEKYNFQKRISKLTYSENYSLDKLK